MQNETAVKNYLEIFTSFFQVLTELGMVQNKRDLSPEDLAAINHVNNLVTDYFNSPLYSLEKLKELDAKDKLLSRKRRPGSTALRTLRLQRGFTLEELASLADLCPSYISRLENGTRRLNADILQKLAHGLRCSVADLVTDGYMGEPDLDKD